MILGADAIDTTRLLPLVTVTARIIGLELETPENYRGKIELPIGGLGVILWLPEITLTPPKDGKEFDKFCLNLVIDVSILASCLT